MRDLLTKTDRALFLAAPHHQGGHSEVGSAIAEALDVPFPLTMGALVSSLRSRGENPAAFYPWLIKMVRIPCGARVGEHDYFTDVEIAEATGGRALLTAQINEAESAALEQGGSR